MEKFDAESILTHKSFERLFGQEFAAGATWHHVVRALVLKTVDAIDAQLVRDDLPARIVVDRSTLADDEHTRPSRWNLVIMIDDSAVVLPLLLTEKVVQVGETAIFVGMAEGPHLLLEALVAEIESTRVGLNLAGAWI